VAPATAALVPWAHLDIGEHLGRAHPGACIMRSGTPVDAKPPQPVALKLFKGAMTSDGRPEREMAPALRSASIPILRPPLAG